jgi:2,5-diamino-6-(ribosylamino)-4(3H)-pyrimidinone 5'-phosphate reductase
MKSNIVLHNQVSVNGAFLGFEVDLEQYYAILNSYHPKYILIGSNTAKSGIDTYYEKTPVESADDFRSPSIEKTDKRPYWVVPDSTGKLLGLLHVYRNAGYCKDIIVMISKNTPKEYKQYLHERHYDFFSEGYNKVDMEKCLERLEKKYGAGNIVTDGGRNLAKRLFDLHLICEISLIVSPLLTKKKYEPLLYNLSIPDNMAMVLESVKKLDKGLVHLKYTCK